LGQGEGGERRTLGRGPALERAGELDTDDLGALELPGNAGHDINGVSTSDTNGNHAEAAGVRGVGVGADHHQSRDCIVLQDNLVDDAASWLPESKTILGRGGAQEVVHLGIDILSEMAGKFEGFVRKKKKRF